MRSSRFAQWLRDVGSAVPFAESHRASFIGGVISALVVVGARLALPWTLNAALKPFVAGRSRSALTPGWIPASVDPLFVYAAAFLILLAIMGYADYRERLSFARFSIGVVHELRSKAAQAIRHLAGDSSGRGIRKGDAIARLIGDTARVKAGLKGFLVHVATNGAMAIGVSVVLIAIDLALGSVFALGVLATGFATWRGATAVYRRAAKYRVKEGALAEILHSSQSENLGSDVFRSGSSESAGHEARITLLEGRATWGAHAIFGATVLGCLVIGVLGTRSGRVDASNLVVFVLYALMMRAPLVQLTRQGVRTGKIVACLERVLEIAGLEPAGGERPADKLGPLKSRLWMRDARVRLGKGAGRRACLRIASLQIPAGQRVAVVGPQGSGKTILLQLLSGSQRAVRGRLTWDEHELNLEQEAQRLFGQTHLVAALPTWSRRPLRSALGVGPGISDDEALAMLRACGAKKLMRRWADGPDTKVASDEFSLGERKQVALVSALLALPGPSLLLIDDLPAGLTKRAAQKAVSAAIKNAGARTLIMTFARPIRIHRFDRVIEMRGGQVVMDTDPVSWMRQSDLVARPAAPLGTGKSRESTADEWEKGGQILP